MANMTKCVKTRVAAVMCCLMLLTAAGAPRAADAGRVFKSAVWPGMGQLGDGQTLKGLSFMASEVALLSLTIANFSKASAYARETEYLSVQYEIDTTYSAKKQTDEFWRDADKAYSQRFRMGVVFGGLAGLWWGLNIADAILFPPIDDNRSTLRSIKENTTVRVSQQEAGLSYTVHF